MGWRLNRAAVYPAKGYRRGDLLAAFVAFVQFAVAGRQAAEVILGLGRFGGQIGDEGEEVGEGLGVEEKLLRELDARRGMQESFGIVLEEKDLGERGRGHDRDGVALGHALEHRVEGS